MEEILIELHLKKSIHTTHGDEVLDINFRVPQYGFVTIFGKSGVGKTTLLRMIAGLSDADSGYIRVGNEIWFDSEKKINIKPQQRNIGFVFQDYALFPNMTVKEHLLFAQPTKEKEFVSELLDIFHLKGLCDKKPSSLSGGQQQRLAVARALARKPQILLLDEPLSALDTETRDHLQDEIIQVHKKFLSTTLLVSHDVDEVSKLSDFVYVIDQGKIQFQGKPADIFNDLQKQAEGQIIGIENNILTVKSNGKILKITLSEEDIIQLKNSN